ADKGIAFSRPLLAAITSNAFLPMLPVDPKTATFLAATDIGRSWRLGSDRGTKRRRASALCLEPIVPIATHGRRAIRPALQKMILSLPGRGGAEQNLVAVTAANAANRPF